jgi:hypothetical protein
MTVATVKLAGVTFLAAIGFCAAPALSQNLTGKQETRDYSYGVGRITWTFPEGLEVDLAPPGWTAGARVQCRGEGVRCEVQVDARDISVSDEDRRSELQHAIRLRLPQQAKQALRIQTRGANPGIAYITLEDRRGRDYFRYLTLGYAYKGAALLNFELASDNLADLGPVLALVDGARAIDALEMWTLRLRDLQAVCEERFPAYKEANDRAFASSPFASVDPVRQEVKAEKPSSVVAIARQRLMEFVAAFDSNPPERRRFFCEGFPKWVAEAAKTL